MTSRNALEKRLREEAMALGADYFGLADLSLAQALVREQGGQMMAQFPRAVSIGVVMPFVIVDLLPHLTNADNDGILGIVIRRGGERRWLMNWHPLSRKQC